MNKLRSIFASVMWLLAVMLCAAPSGHALELTSGQHSAALEPALVFWPEDGSSLADKIARFRAGGFHPTLAGATATIRPYQPVWGAVEITNRTPDDGRAGDPWHLTSDIFGLIALEALVVRANGLTETILRHDARAPFDAAAYDGHRLRSPAVVLAPAERVLLMVKMTYGPVMAAHLELETPTELAARTFIAGITTAAFYSVALTCLVFFAGFALSMRHGLGVGYAGLLFLGLALAWYVDGYAFRFLYPEHPEAHLPVGFLITLLLSGLGFLVAGYSMRTFRPTGRLGAGALALGALSIACIALIPVLAPEVLAPICYGLGFLMVCAHVVAVGQWPAPRPGVRRILRIGAWACAVTVLGLVVPPIVGGIDMPLDPGVLIKLLYAITAAWLIYATIVTVLDLRREHAEAIANELASARREADQARARLAAEQDYTRARDLAALRQRQLASASHDLRQPLTSLRLTFDAMLAGQDPALRARMTEAFDYIEGLSSGYLAETTPDDNPPPPDPAGQADPIEIGLVLDTVHQMFGEEALSKGIALRRVRSSCMTTAPAMALMRIVSNLVSNAVKYTERGRVLFGVRRRPGFAEILVCDTGPGMTEAEISRFTAAYQKGAQSDGTGLGLSICADLARANGLTLRARSRPGLGTVFTLRVPCHDD